MKQESEPYRHPFCHRLVELRENSRWPTRGEFAQKIGMSLGGYQKCESGTRVMGRHLVRCLCEILKLDNKAARELIELRDSMKAEQLGITQPTIEDVPEPEAVSGRIQKEISYVLKQAGIRVPAATEKVIEKRVTLILKNSTVQR